MTFAKVELKVMAVVGNKFSAVSSQLPVKTVDREVMTLTNATAKGCLEVRSSFHDIKSTRNLQGFTGN